MLNGTEKEDMVEVTGYILGNASGKLSFKHFVTNQAQVTPFHLRREGL